MYLGPWVDGLDLPAGLTCRVVEVEAESNSGKHAPKAELEDLSWLVEPLTASPHTRPHQEPNPWSREAFGTCMWCGTYQTTL